MKTDFLIIGQGIAGSLLAWLLSKNKKSFIVIDEGASNNASKVAAGIINPVTGKRLVESWKIKELLSFSEKTYSELEQYFGIKVFHQKNILKYFSNDEDLRFFQEKKEKKELGDFIRELNNLESQNLIQNNLGGVEIHGGGHLDFTLLMETIREWLKKEKQLIEQQFLYERLILGDGISYENISAEKVIFCEGSKAIHNPYFNWLPFNLAKGELLTVHIPGFPEEKIFYKGVFILPQGDEIFKVGSTYEWNFDNENPTEEKKEELKLRLESTIDVPFEIINHQAAIRPTVKDRRPFIGIHPAYPQLAIFNGLGTKGASLAPYFANHLTEYLVNNTSLDEEVNINRFIAIFPEKR